MYTTKCLPNYCSQYIYTIQANIHRGSGSSALSYDTAAWTTHTQHRSHAFSELSHQNPRNADFQQINRQQYDKAMLHAAQRRCTECGK